MATTAAYWALVLSAVAALRFFVDINNVNAFVVAHGFVSGTFAPRCVANDVTI